MQTHHIVMGKGTLNRHHRDFMGTGRGVFGGVPGAPLLPRRSERLAEDENASLLDCRHSRPEGRGDRPRFGAQPPANSRVNLRNAPSSVTEFGAKTILMVGLALGSQLVSSGLAEGKVREYWIGADEISWDYAPSFPLNPITGKDFTEEALVFVGDGSAGADGVVGRIYRKAVYRAYRPGFTALKPHPEGAEHLGILGPIIRAEVGDTIIVHFRNNTGFPSSIHPHGMLYDKNAEGALYDDGTELKGDDFVAPHGGRHTYTWRVPKRAGPGNSDPSSILWMYHGHVDEPADTNAGLVGPIIVTRKGMARPDASPKDVDREFVSLFTVFDENASTYRDANIAQFTDLAVDTADEGFQESNLMHAINGRLFGNNRGYAMAVGERIRWHVMGMGTEVDIHLAHWHGLTALRRGGRTDVAEVFPASMKTYDLMADNPGTWLFHCHVNDHIAAGMVTTFTVRP